MWKSPAVSLRPERATKHASEAYLPATVSDLSHLLRIAVPMPPELRVRADLGGVHPLGN
jgi:hypothetical protein